MNENTAAIEGYSAAYAARHNADYTQHHSTAQQSLVKYVARRCAKGEAVEIVRDVVISGPYARATISVSGKLRRVWNLSFAPWQSWRYN